MSKKSGGMSKKSGGMSKKSGGMSKKSGGCQKKAGGGQKKAPSFSFSRFFIAFGEHFLFSMSPEVVHLQNQQDSEFYIYCKYLYII